MKGTFTCPPESQGGKHRGGAVGSTMGFSYAAQVVEVSVDEATGAVTVDKVWTALDCGHAINPLAVEGQIEGSVWMGMGQALSEETRYLDGLPAHASLLEYRVPTIVESPPIEVADRRKPRSEWAVRRQGSKRRRPRRISAGLGQRRRQRHRHRAGELPVTPDRMMEALIQRRRHAACQRGRPRHDRSRCRIPSCPAQRPSPKPLRASPNIKQPILAGGTDLLVNMRHGLSSPDPLIDLAGIDELSASR